MRTKAKRAIQKLLTMSKHVSFADKAEVRTYNKALSPITVTYNSGANRNYLSKSNRRKAYLPILRKSTRRVGVADGTVCHGKHVTRLPVPDLVLTATKAYTFEKFPHSLMSVGKTSDAGTVSIFTKDGVTVHNEEDMLIACKGEPILIGARNKNGRYLPPPR